MLRVENGRETLVRVRHGCVWLTQEGEGRDIALRSDQEFRISRDGCTLIEALQDSEIELLSPDRGHSGRSRMEALGTSLLKAWFGLYAPPPRRARQLV
jgi:hypothetical protein